MILIELISSLLIRLFGKVADAGLEWGVGRLLDRLVEGRLRRITPKSAELFPPTCGDTKFELSQQRLLVSTAFGSYFAGLLEREQGFVQLEGQISYPNIKGLEGFHPLQGALWTIHNPKGPHLLILAGSGGMGKSTLAAKIIRCLYELNAVDIILGDSAKIEYVDPATGKVTKLEQTYYDVSTFYKRLCMQLGLPSFTGSKAIQAIQDRLIGNKAIIMVDDLNSVKKGMELLTSVRRFTSRDVRAIVTTREVSGLRQLNMDYLVINLTPLINPHDVRRFLNWHTDQYQAQHHALQDLLPELNNTRRIKWLIERTGGNPLLLQLVWSDAARHSWEYVEKLPALYGEELLNYLYEAKWQELDVLSEYGQTAKALLHWLVQQHYLGKKVDSTRLQTWAREAKVVKTVTDALSLLYERFLIVNQDQKKGDFTVMPSLALFIKQQRE